MDILYSNFADEGRQNNRYTLVAKVNGRVYRATTKLDTSYAFQSEATLAVLIPQRGFEVLIHQLGSEVESAAYYHGLPHPERGRLGRDGGVEELMGDAAVKLIRTGDLIMQAAHGLA